MRGPSDSKASFSLRSRVPWLQGVDLRVGHKRTFFLLALFFIGVILILNTGQYVRSEAGDRSLWDYSAQAILRGQIPYRDVVQIKTPLSAYVSAFALLIARRLSVDGLVAIRLLKILMAAGLLVTTYAVAEKYFQSKSAALIAFLVPLGLKPFAAQVSVGTEQKLPMILFGMLALLLAAKDRPFWAGFASMLSYLCWQPGLLFTGTVVLVFSGYLRKWRDLRALKAVIGAAIPLALTVGYFCFEGALRDFWRWTFVYDLTVYAPHSARGLGGQARHIWVTTYKVIGVEGAIVFGLALIGYIAAWARLLRGKNVGGVGDSGLFSASMGALLIPPLIYVTYWRFDFNSGPYLIPLYPFAGLFLGLLVSSFGEGATAAIGRFKLSNVRRKSLSLAILFAPGLVVILLVSRAVSVSCTKKYSGPTLEDQYREIRTVTQILSPNDTFYAHGDVSMLVLLDKPRSVSE